MALTLNILPRPIDQTWSVIQIARTVPPRTWETVFHDADAELAHISQILDNQEAMYGSYYPLKQDIFAAFHHTPLPSVRVVIVGQDPYHQSIVVNGVNMPRAVGLSFSVRPTD